MDAVFKKYAWVINLAAIALMALLVAKGVGDYLKSQVLFQAPTWQGTKVAESEVKTVPTLGRLALSSSSSQDLKERRAFNLDPPKSDKPDDKVADATATDKAEEPEKPPEEGELEESDLPIDLIGTLVAEDENSSMATLRLKGKENKLAWVGQELLDGDAKLVTIGQRHIIVEEKGLRKTIIRLWADKGKAGAKPGRARPGAKRPGRGGPSALTRPPAKPRPAKKDRKKSSRPNWSEGVKKKGAYEWDISREMLNEQLNDLTALGSEARIVPNYRGGKYQGFKLVGVRPGSLYRAIGIRSGDVIKGINGRPIDSPNKAIQLFEELKSQPAIKLEIERRGQPKVLNYAIE